MPDSTRPTLYLIDGYAQFFRAYHAIRTPMTSPVTKEPTNMTFGFIGMLLKLLRAEGPNLGKAGKPDYIAVALDVSKDKETFRSILYPQYKATRKEPPDDLFPQVDRCMDMLKAIGVPLLGVPGFEADDLIGTLVGRLRAQHPDLRIRIVSKDKDLKQLLEPAKPDAQPLVELFDVHTDQPFDAAKLMEETGLRPDQVVDMLTLMGDTVDNVPGVPGVGDKTAAQLIREWGTLDNLLAHSSEITGKRGENLRATAPNLPLSKQLVTLRCDVPFDFSLESASVKHLALENLGPILRELGFNRYQDELKALIGGGPTPTTAETVAPTASPATPRAAAARADAPGQGGLFDAIGAAAASQTQRPPQSGTYTCITTRSQLTSLAKDLACAPLFAVDTETTSLSFLDAKLCGISISTRAGTGAYIPIRSPTPQAHLDEDTVLGVLRPILEDPTKPKVGQNLKYDMLVLRSAGVQLRGLSAPLPETVTSPKPVSASEGPAPATGSWPGCDTMIASYLIDASRSSHGLDSLALALLGRTNISINDLIGSGKNQRSFDTVPIDQATCYAAEDADVALQLYEHMAPQLRAMQLLPLLHDVELPLVEVLAELEWNGILVDPAELDRQRIRLQLQIDELLKKIKAESIASLGRAFDPDSPRQLAAALFNKPGDDTPGLGIKPLRKTKTGYSTDAEVLDKIAQDETIPTPIPKLILEYRQLTKLVSTYLVALKEAIHPRTRRIHSSFSQTVAATGRLASSDPNLQNIPIRTDVGREIRRAFIAPPGHVLITADYSQIELRLLAHLSRDPALIQAFHEGQDIHTAVAAQIHNILPSEVTREQRGGAKMVNFGIVYGITSYGLARRLNIHEKQAAEIILGYKRRFSGITTFLQECVEQARRFGYVQTMLGRRRPITDTDSNNPSRRALAERLAINSVVQGSAADLIKLAMVDLHRRLTTNPVPDLAGVRMLLQIHDELVFEAPEEIAPAARDIIVHRMEQAMTLTVPLKADAYIAKNWHEGK